MPYLPPSRTPSGPRRRSLLAAAGATLLLAGCSAGPGSGDGGPSAFARARARAARDSVDLLARYDVVLAGHPALADRLGPLRAQVAAHVEAFGGKEAKATASASPSVTPSATASRAARASAPATPSATGTTGPSGATTAKEALASLAAAERALADRRTHDLLDMPAELARLMASVAAAGAVHAYLLTAPAAPGEGDQ
ncbi:hypothetical protein [Streptomyces sp. NPDC005573]|uniref:hypothetical protein n=1 Tax=unclassified Streptomyces TaxID=2593676 RepID=UPI0033B75379